MLQSDKGGTRRASLPCLGRPCGGMASGFHSDSQGRRPRHGPRPRVRRR
jgi:hypothetical protein